MGKQQNRKPSNKQDWKSQLQQINKQIKAEVPEEERKKLERERALESEKNRLRKIEFDKRKTSVYQFLAGYKQNSGIFINNFFRNRDYKLYCQDKFHTFDFDVSGIIPNFFDDWLFSFMMVEYLSELEEGKNAYYPISKSYIDHLIAFSEALDILPRLEEDTILYRGCSTIERNGVNGIVSTTTDEKIAEQFSRGTIIKLHVPKGTKCLNVKSIRPKEQQKKDFEKEILLPPCNYEVLSEKETKRGKEPNNRINLTKHLEIRVEALDLLTEFYKRMCNPPTTFFRLDEEYTECKRYLNNYINERNKGNNPVPKILRK